MHGIYRHALSEAGYKASIFLMDIPLHGNAGARERLALFITAPRATVSLDDRVLALFLVKGS